MEMLEAWITKSNDALRMNLTRPGSNAPIFEEPFSPDFTYPIFGDDEVVFGYKDLEMNLTFRANDLRPKIAIKYSEEWKLKIGDTKPMDIKGMLKPFLPESAFSQDDSSNGTDSDAVSADWKPPGEKINSYTFRGKKFEIWCASLMDPRAKEIMRNMHILTPLYIEGGTLQDLDDQPWTIERWKLFLLYEVTPAKDCPCPYTFAGFSTSYRLWVFPKKELLGKEVRPETHAIDSDTQKLSPFDPLRHPSRERISQFIIIPPYQGQSHGSRLYDAMMDHFIADPDVFEVTVEDPNEAFDDLRDWSDLARLRQKPLFTCLTLTTTIPEDLLKPDSPIPVEQIVVPHKLLERIHRASKLAPRQFARLVEMQLLSTIPAMHRSPARITQKHRSASQNDRRYYFWRLLVKERLYKHNRDQLAQLERAERVQKVDQTCRVVEDDYKRLLDGATRRARRARGGARPAAAGDAMEGVEQRSEKARGKRKARLVEDEEDEEAWEDVEEESGRGGAVKKARAV